MRSNRRLVFILLAALLAGPLHAAELGPVELKIPMSVIPGMMKFDVTRFTVRPGSVVEVALTNPDNMPHNWLLCRGKPGETEIELARLAVAMPDANEKGYVPESPLVLASTKMLNPQQSHSIIFRAPAEEGDYPYVCTYPGHAMVMRGVMKVSKKDPVGVGAPAVLQKLSYMYYEGNWKSLPTFDNEKAKSEADLEKNIVTLKPRQRDENFGMMFDAELIVRDAGRYRFYAGGKGGWRLTINNKKVTGIEKQSRNFLISDGTIDLKPGTHEFRLEYFHTADKPIMGLACKFEADGGDVFSLSSDNIADRVGRLMLQVGVEPRVVRLSLPDASARSMAVGLVGGMNYCFDATDCSVRYAWDGDLLNAAPERGNATGRGGEMCPVEDIFQVGSTKSQPLQIGTSDSKPTIQFQGYRLNKTNPPSFLYRINGTAVTQTVESTSGGRGLRYLYKLEPAPAEPVTFTVRRKGLNVSSSTGAWTGDVLTIPAGQAGEFSVTIDRPADAHAEHGAMHHAH